jgi:hypothetical protein
VALVGVRGVADRVLLRGGGFFEEGVEGWEACFYLPADLMEAAVDDINNKTLR